MHPSNINNMDWEQGAVTIAAGIARVQSMIV